MKTLPTVRTFAALTAFALSGVAFGARITDLTGLNLQDLTQPGGTVTGSSCLNPYHPPKLFDDDLSTSNGRWLANWSGTGPAYVVYTFAEATEIDGYSLLEGTAGVNQNRAPVDFKLLGSNDYTGSNYGTATWVELDHISGEEAWPSGESSRYYRLADAVKYKSYCLHVTAIQKATDYCQLSEMQLHKYVSGAKVTVKATLGATTTSTVQEVPVGTEVTVSVPTAPVAGGAFWFWTGDTIANSNCYAQSLKLTAMSDMTVTANFYDPAKLQRKIAYVVPDGAGNRDGTSWANAFASVDTAYAAVSDSPLGGEVWIKTGRYALPESGIRMRPNVTVRGGFAGDETSADAADPAAHPTYLCDPRHLAGDETYADLTPMWTGEDGMTFVEPPQAGDDQMYLKVDSAETCYAFRNDDGAPIEEAQFCGISFFKYLDSVLTVSSPHDKPVTFDNCRILCCGWAKVVYEHLLEMQGTAVILTNCAIIGCRNGVMLKASTGDGAAVPTSTVARCRFYSCGYSSAISGAGVAAGIAVRGNAQLTLKASSFDRTMNESGSDWSGGALSLRNVRPTAVADTVFSRCVGFGASRGSAVTFNPQVPGIGLTLERCRFESNRYSGNGCDQHNCTASALGGKIEGTEFATLVVRDTSFFGNSVTNCPYTYPCGSCVGLTGRWRGSFENCTFERNSTCGEEKAVEKESAKKMYTITTAWSSKRYFTFANCVFNENRNGYVALDGSFVPTCEIRPADAYNEGQTFSFVNTVFANSEADYLPFDSEHISLHYNFASCQMTGAGTYGTASDEGFRLGLLATNAVVALKAVLETNGVVVARGLAPESPNGRSSTPAYRADDGDLYLYDPSYRADAPWRLGRGPATVLTEEEAVAHGLSRTRQIPDAFGRPRPGRKCTLGPLDVPPGMLLLVR